MGMDPYPIFCRGTAQRDRDNSLCSDVYAVGTHGCRSGSLYRMAGASLGDQTLVEPVHRPAEDEALVGAHDAGAHRSCTGRHCILAIIFVNGFLVMLAGVLQVMFRNQIRFSWALIFYGLAGIFIGLWLYHSRLMPTPKEDVQTERTVGEVTHELKNMFRTFFTKFGVRETVIVMLFLLFYRFPEALLNTMTKTFILRPNSQGGLGMSPQEYGLANGTVGLIGLLLGGIIGGILVSRDGMKKWLWPMVCAITLPDAVYIYLSYSLNSDIVMVSSCLFVEQFGYGLGFTVLTLYMLFYSQGKFKTSHYSICTGISYLGLMLPGMVSGYLKDILGYRHFFIVVMACCVITFLVTDYLKIDPDFGKKEKEMTDEEEMADEEDILEEEVTEEEYLEVKESSEKQGLQNENEKGNRK